MLNLYVFKSYNSQQLYGWGDEAAADAYCDHLNRDREFNVYAWAEITDPGEVAKHDDGETGVNLSDELAAIRDQA